MKLQYHDYNSELEYICGKVHLSFCQMVAIIMTIITLGLIFVFHKNTGRITYIQGISK